MIPITSPKFQDPGAYKEETLRVYDICNGCRRCFNLCPSFDVLFRGIDDKDGEPDKVEASVVGQVVRMVEVEVHIKRMKIPEHPAEFFSDAGRQRSGDAGPDADDLKMRDRTEGGQDPLQVFIR